MSSRLLVVLTVVICLFTRFYKLNWGNGFYFQPDENNMAVAISQFTSNNLHPHFFAYNQFPLYLGYFTLNLFHLPNTFSNSIMVLRFYSAAFSVLSVFVMYKISKKLINRSAFPWLIFLFIFNPGFIQAAHFGTTESLLILIFLISIYLSFLIVDTKETKYILMASLIGGLGLATKVSSLIFVFPILLSLLINLVKSKKIIEFLFRVFYFLLFTFLFSLVLSPFSLIELGDFLSSMSYETRVATGHISVFYTSQFIHTVPYLFQIIHIFPYSSGLPVFIVSFLGFVLLIRNWKLEIRNSLYWFLTLASCLIYFAYFGQLYTKWTRFMSPVFFVFPLIAGYFISTQRYKLFRVALLIISCLPGVYFMSLYLNTDIRLSASRWLVSSLPPETNVLSEGGNASNLPVINHQFPVKNYDFYNYQPLTLAASLEESEYLIVPSRRVFKNYNYPYYDHLFDGSLGFRMVKNFTPNNDLFLNSEDAEETWSVFDHPTIRVYKKVNQLSVSQYEDLL